MIETTVKCDVCKEVKKEANHWYTVHFLFNTSEGGMSTLVFYTVVPWAEKGSDEYERCIPPIRTGDIDVCGLECLNKAESALLRATDPRAYFNK